MTYPVFAEAIGARPLSSRVLDGTHRLNLRLKRGVDTSTWFGRRIRNGIDLLSVLGYLVALVCTACETTFGLLLSLPLSALNFATLSSSHRLESWCLKSIAFTMHSLSNLFLLPILTLLGAFPSNHLHALLLRRPLMLYPTFIMTFLAAKAFHAVKFPEEGMVTNDELYQRAAEAFIVNIVAHLLQSIRREAESSGERAAFLQQTPQQMSALEQTLQQRGLAQLNAGFLQRLVNGNIDGQTNPFDEQLRQAIMESFNTASVRRWDEHYAAHLKDLAAVAAKTLWEKRALLSGDGKEMIEMVDPSAFEAHLKLAQLEEISQLPPDMKTYCCPDAARKSALAAASALFKGMREEVVEELREEEIKEPREEVVERLFKGRIAELQRALIRADGATLSGKAKELFLEIGKLIAFLQRLPYASNFDCTEGIPDEKGG